MMVRDLARETAALPKETAIDIWKRTIPAVVPHSISQDVARWFSEVVATTAAAVGAARTQRRKRIGKRFIVTVLAVEYYATLHAFGRSPKTVPDFQVVGIHFIVYVAQPDGSILKVGIGVVGEARNVPCAAYIGLVSKYFSFKSIILVGIAGGNRKLTQLCDVISADQVVDMAGGRTHRPPFYQRLVGVKSIQERRIESYRCSNALK